MIDRGRALSDRVRVPLYLKVMASYLVVVGLVLVPTLLYLRTLLVESLRESAMTSLESELDGLVARFGRVAPDQLDEAMAFAVGALPQRVTVVDMGGNVIADSVVGSRLSNHAHRPEIAEALRDGRGRAVRSSTTTHDERIYVARRFPTEGPPRGVIRLSIPTHDVEDTVARSFAFVEKAGALGLSAAVLLSFVAALVVSRPLRRLREALDAYRQGDFGHVVEVDSGDELGEVADALRALAAQLKQRLVDAGLDRATLEHLLESLPVGVVLYGPDDQPMVVNGAARELCQLLAFDELERASEILRLPEQRIAAATAREDHEPVDAPLVLPWRPKSAASLAATWVPVPAEGGHAKLALIVTGEEDLERARMLASRLDAAAELLEHAAPQVSDPAFAARLARLAEESRRALLPRSSEKPLFRPVKLTALLDGAVDALRGRADQKQVILDLDVEQPAAMVAEAEGRCALAVRTLVDAMIDEAPASSSVAVVGAVENGHVRVLARTPQGRKLKTKTLAAIVHPIGGDAGSKHTGEASEAWVKLPRA